MFGIKPTRRIIIGLALIYLAGLCWLAELYVPLSSWPNKIAIFSALLIAGELLFIAGVAVLGKPVYNNLKAQLQDYVKNRGR